MKILVTVKRVLDYEARIRAQADGRGVESEGIKWIVNPFDEIAVEEAVRLREKGVAHEVLAVSVGSAESAAQLRQAIGIGADRGLLVRTEEALDCDGVARVLAYLVRREKPDVVLMGKQSIDSDASQVPQILAGRLGWPQACFASRIECLENPPRQLLVWREVDGGLEALRLPMPCVISADLRLNEPRFVSLPNMMRAKKKPLEELSSADIPDLAGYQPRLVIRRLSTVPPRQGGRKVASIEELFKLVREEKELW